jgi:hypothetical protein
MHLARLQPYTYHLTLAVFMLLLLGVDAHTTTLLQQDALGLLTFLVLFVSTRFSPPAERRQVWLMVGIATCVEIFCSLLWGMYAYRFHNIPWYVPPGHGLIYLFALRWGRTPLMARHGDRARRIVLACALAAGGGGLTLEPLFLGRLDLFGLLLLPIFLYFMRTPSAPIFAGAFLATSVLEIMGTGFGNWTWVTWAPVLHLPVGNPPSVIAGGYCILDFATLRLAGMLPQRLLPERLLLARRYARA